MTYELRDMKRTDIPVIATIEKSLQGKTAWSAHGFHDALDLTPERYACRVGVPTGSAEPVAYGVVSVAGPRGGVQAEVQNIAVAPAHQRRGLGTLLLTDLVDRARDRGASEMFLDVRAGNEAAIALYVSFGFVEIAQRRAYYGPSDDAVVMRVSLLSQGISPGRGAGRE